MKKNKGAVRSNENDSRHSPDKLFESVKHEDIISQVSFAVRFEDPVRGALLTLIEHAEPREEVRRNVSLIRSRIDLFGLPIPGFTKGEVVHYQNIFAKHFINVLHTEGLTGYIEDEIRELYRLCERLEHELKLNQFEFIEDRDSTVDLLTENRRLKEYLEAVVNNYSRQGTVHVKANLREPESFEELFNDGFNPMDFVDILKDTEPPLIDSRRNFIGKPKGAICVWYEEMKRQGIVKQVPDKVLSVLIPKAINRFSINESMFRRTHKDAELTFKSDLKALISKVKSSQDSQM
jgi:hypothetical protein